MRTDNGISVHYIYSACTVISTKDLKILSDPWFTEGAYDGSWYQFPKVKDPIAKIGDVDYIYVSHIHPDHYDSEFIKEYFQEYGEKEILIADHSPNYLLQKMKTDGLKATVLQEPFKKGDTTVEILPHKTGSVSDIDSAMVVRFHDGLKEHTVINCNDIIFDDATITQFKTQFPSPDILLCGYTGAGPYPQTYFNLTDEALLVEADKKKKAFFQRYLKLVNAMNAKVNIPFAGKYILGGKLTPLNPYRGVADAVEILDVDPRALVLADEGGIVNTADFIPTKTRTEKYQLKDIQKREEEISKNEFRYEKLMRLEEVHQLPLKRLLGLAALKAQAKSECFEDYFFVFNLPTGEYVVINANKNSEHLISYHAQRPVDVTPRSEIEIDPRYLFGLLTHVYHWNNAEVGSMYMTSRYPNQFNRYAQNFLIFLTV